MSTVPSFLEKLRQMRFLTVSFLIHIGLITFLGGVVLFKAAQQIETFEATSGFIETPADDGTEESDPGTAEEFEEPELAEVAVVQPQMPATALTSLTSAPTTVISAPTAVQMQSIGATLSPNLSPTLSTRNSGSSSAGGRKMGALSSRSTGERAMHMKMGGGTEEAEEAVMRGLRWLKNAQNPDGTWGQKYRGAMTGLALLSFLGHGETPQDSVEFGGCVSRGIDALLAQSDVADGRLGFSGKSFAAQPSVYEHGIATYALAEAFAMGKEAKVGATLTKAVDHIVKGQRPDGGWAYGFTLTPDADPAKPASDTSVSGWMIQALKTAKLAGLHHEALETSLASAMKNMERVFDEKTGSFGYRRAGDRKPGALTGVGVLSVFFIEGKGNQMTRKGLSAISDLPRLDYKAKETDLYGWYYMTQACFQAQGSAWSRWNRMFQNELIKSQSPDGSWPVHGGGTEHGMNKPGPDPDIYRTALSVLMLEVYYRYSPVSKMVPQG